MISHGLPKMSGGQRKYDQSWAAEDEWRAKKVFSVVGYRRCVEDRESMINHGLPKRSGGQRKYDQSWVTKDEWRAEKVCSVVGYQR